jgi:hypothetical protein
VKVRRYENAMIPGCTAAWQEVGTISCSLEPSPLLSVPIFCVAEAFSGARGFHENGQPFFFSVLKFMGSGESFLSLDFKSLL